MFKIFKIDFLNFKLVAKALFVFVLCVFSFITYEIHTSLEHNNKVYFDRLVQESTHELQERFGGYKQALIGGEALFNSSDHVNYNEWKTYVKTLNIKQNLKGLNGIGFIEYVKAKNEDDFLKNVQILQPNFNIYPKTNNEEKFIIRFIEPFEQNKEAIGLDIAFEENRHEAAIYSKNNNTIAITDKIALVQDARRTPGFLLLNPVYKKNKDFYGWVHATIIGRNLLYELDEKSNKKLGFRIYDGPDMTTDNLIHATHLEYPYTEIKSAYKRKEIIKIANQSWYIEWFSTELFSDKYTPFIPYVIFFIGFVTASFIYFLIRTVFDKYEILSQAERDKSDLLTQQLAIQGSDLGIWDTNIVSGKTTFNDRWCSMLGYQKEELAPHFATLESLVHPDDYDQAIFAFERHLNRETAQYESEFRAKCKNGDWKWILARGKVLERDDDGTAKRIIGTHSDIDDRKKDEASIREKTKLLELAEITAQVGHWRIDTTNNQVYWSDQIYRIHGLKKESYNPELHSSINLYREDFRDIVRKSIDKAINNRDSFEFEAIIIKPNGEEAHVFSKGQLELSQDREIIAIFGIFQDITRRKNLEKELESQKLIAVQNSKLAMLGEMSAGVAHEINNPLAIINGQAEIMEVMIEKEKIESLPSSLATIKKSVNRIFKIVSGLKKFSRTSQSQTSEIISVSFLTSEIKDITDYAMSRHDIDFKISCPDQLFIKGNQTELEQVFINLIMNAKDAVKDMNDPWIRITVKENKKVVIFELQDSGHGIPQDVSDKLFTPFYTTKATNEGTGLGLSISHGIIEAHGGKIYYDDTQKNTTFIIEMKSEKK